LKTGRTKVKAVSSYVHSPFPPSKMLMQKK
jgi:hypothetical protein